MLADLHSHTLASDGELSPAELLAEAERAGIDLLAITDHDTLAGYRQVAALESQVQLVAGVEYSSVWRRMNIHIVGLGVDPNHTATLEAEAMLYEARQQRAVMISEKLEKRGLPPTLEGALELAGQSQVGRPHFARYMVAEGIVPTMERAFDRYLGAGKPGDVKALWPEMEQVVKWIVAAGGVAVIAHPLKYSMTRTKLRELVADFTAAGGAAIEVVSGRQRLDLIQQMHRLADEFSLYASVGSDYHGPSTPWCALGQSSELPRNCRPVWQALGY